MYSVFTFFRLTQYKRPVEKMWTQNTCIIHDVWRLLILSNEEKTNDYENFEKGMIYMKILKKKGGVVEKRGEEETKSMPHAPVATTKSKYYDHIVLLYLESRRCRYRSIIFACFYLYTTVVIFIDYSDIDKMMDINNEKC